MIAVAQDVATAQSAIESLVSAYNEFEKIFDEATAIENSEGEMGALRSDSGIRAIREKVKAVFMGESSTPGENITRISDMGVSLQRNGDFEVDSSKLADALKNNFSDVTKLFTANTNNQSPYGDKSRGIAGDLVVQIEDYLSSRGIIQTRVDTYDAKVQELKDDQTALDAKLESVEARYTKQFTTMNKIMDEMKNMQSYLEGQLDNLPYTANND